MLQTEKPMARYLDGAIGAINSLGGPPLPIGLDRKTVQVTLENLSAQDCQFWQVQTILQQVPISAFR